MVKLEMNTVYFFKLIVAWCHLSRFGGQHEGFKGAHTTQWAGGEWGKGKSGKGQ